MPVAMPRGRHNLDAPATPNDYVDWGAMSSSARRRRRRARSTLRLATLSVLVGIVVDGVVPCPRMSRAWSGDSPMTTASVEKEE